MLFDNLPTELIMMIADRTDLVTRCHISQASRRISTIYSKFPKGRKVEKVTITSGKSREKLNTVHILGTINDGIRNVEIDFNKNNPQKMKYLLEISHIVELSFNDISCGNYSFEKIFAHFPFLRIIQKLAFENCVLIFHGDFITNIIKKYAVASIKGVYSSDFEGSVQTLINDTELTLTETQRSSFQFLCSFLGDFNFTVGTERNMTNMKTRITDKTLEHILETNQSNFKLENVSCQFTVHCLAKVVKTALCSNCKINWNLGVIVVPSDVFDFYNQVVHQSLTEVPLAENDNYTTYFWNRRGTTAREFKIKRGGSRVEFNVQPGEKAASTKGATVSEKN